MADAKAGGRGVVHPTLSRLDRLRRSLRSRQRGQDLVEYGLIAASIAFVAVVGLNVLSDREAAYFNSLPLAPAAPSAPGVLVHLTSTGVVCNIYEVPALVQTPITCTATVQDQLLPNVSDRQPPWGKVTWTFPDGSTQVCVLPSLPAGSQTSCPPVTYSPNANSYIPGAYSVTASYEPTSNHYPSTAAVSVIIDPPNIIPSCTNKLRPGLPAGQVELGNPLDCQVTLTSGGNKLLGQQITWQHAGSAAGVGIFTCRTQGTGYNIWTNAAQCPPPDLTGTGALSCTTDGNGLCGVIYRRLYDSFGGGIGTNPVLSLRLGYINGTSTTVNYNAIKVIPPVLPHATDTAAVCSRTSGTATVSPGSLADGNAIFNTTASVAIDFGTANFSCIVRVVDTQPNPAASSGNPDDADAYPPLGSVALTYNTAPVGNCVLQPVATTAAAPPAQAPGQEPFFAACTSPIKLTDLPGSSGTLQVSFGAEPGHAASSFSSPVTFN